MGQANILRGAQVQNLEFLIKNSFVLPHQDFTSFRLLRFQIRYVREKISMGDHGYLHGGMVAPSWRGMQFLRFGGGIARRYIDRLVANHNGEEEDYSWNSELERLLRNLVVSLSPLPPSYISRRFSDNRTIPGRVWLETRQRVFEISRIFVRRYMGSSFSYTTGRKQDNTLPSQSDHVRFQIQGRALGEAFSGSSEKHQFRGRHGRYFLDSKGKLQNRISCNLI